MMSTKLNIGLLITLCVVAVGVFFGLRESEDSGVEESSSVAQIPAYTVPFDTAKYDYEPATGPAQVAQRLAEAPGGGVVIRGQIEDYNAGRVYQTGPASHTMVMSLSVHDVYAGVLPQGSDSTVHVEFDAPGGEKMESFLERARTDSPPGTEGVFYLWNMPPNGIFPEVDQVNPEAGRPAGASLFRPFPQGVFIALPGSETVISPSENEVYLHSTLADFLPTNAEFPEAQRREPGGPTH